jgi:hypothetical protein
MGKSFDMNIANFVLLVVVLILVVVCCVKKPTEGFGCTEKIKKVRKERDSLKKDLKYVYEKYRLYLNTLKYDAFLKHPTLRECNLETACHNQGVCKFKKYGTKAEIKKDPICTDSESAVPACACPLSREGNICYYGDTCASKVECSDDTKSCNPLNPSPAGLRGAMSEDEIKTLVCSKEELPKKICANA